MDRFTAMGQDQFHEVDSHEEARKYYPLRALIMYEEAQAMGVVPKFDAEEAGAYIRPLRSST